MLLAKRFGFHFGFVVLGLSLIMFAAAPGLIADEKPYDREKKEKAELSGEVNVSAIVNVIKDGETVKSVETNPANGEFLVEGLSAGVYSLEVIPVEEGYESELIAEIQVEEGESKDLGLIELNEVAVE